MSAEQHDYVDDVFDDMFPLVDEDDFEPDYYDYLDEIQTETQKFLDETTLTNEEIRDLFTPPNTKDWRDISPEDAAATVTFDSAKESNWQKAKEEIFHVKSSFRDILGCEQDEDPTHEDIVNLTLGINSEVGKYLKQCLDLSDETYLKFMGTFALQSAYRVTCTELFSKESVLEAHAMMSKKEYIDVWRKMSEARKVPDGEIRTTRSNSAIWEGLEPIVNKLCGDISITNRKGKIAISLDDDKIWLAVSQSGRDDLYNLKYTTHVKPNRKGIVGHTAVSVGALMPLGLKFEKTKDSPITCAKDLLDIHFRRDGSTDLSNVDVHFDRGYSHPNMVFGYVLKCGGNVVGTIMRLLACWPFTFKQTLKENDPRTLIEMNGAPSLFLKFSKKESKYCYSSAFRNGSGSVATAISTLHNHHQWEGVVLFERMRTEYEKDEKSLVNHFFVQVVNNYDDNESADEIEKKALCHLLASKIVPYTLLQGKKYFKCTIFFTIYYLLK